MRVIADVDDVPEEGCLAAADGRVLLTHVDGQLRAYENRCLHRGARLEEGTVYDGVLTCPSHFWRYDLADGRVVGGEARLPEVDTEVVDGQVRAEIPPPDPRSLREQLREHARTWRRDEATTRRGEAGDDG